MRRGLLLVVLSGSLLTAAAGATAPATLPLTGTTPHGERFRVQAGPAEPGDDVRTSWCLRLRYTHELSIDGDPFTGGASTCGPSPAPPVSGLATADCEHRTLFVFGGRRTGARGVELVTHDGVVTRAREAVLPPRAGFAGRTFALAADLDTFPATLRETARGHRIVARFASRARICVPVPGAPSGGTPLLDVP